MTKPRLVQRKHTARAGSTAPQPRGEGRKGPIGGLDSAGDVGLGTKLGCRIRTMRKASGLTLDALAERSGVSRAMLSKVERGEKNPTLAVMTRIAHGLGSSLSGLMGAETETTPVAIRRAGQRLSFYDEETGFERHLLSPAHIETGVELLLHIIPPGASSGLLPAYDGFVEKHLIIQEGQLSVHLDDGSYRLQAGDSFYFQIRAPYRFVNEAETRCSYYCVIVRRP